MLQTRQLAGLGRWCQVCFLYLQARLGVAPSMMLAVAVVFLGLQMTSTVTPTLIPSSIVSASAARAEEPSSTPSATARMKLDSIYAADKGRPPGVTPVSVAQNSQSFSTIRSPEANEKRRPN